MGETGVATSARIAGGNGVGRSTERVDVVIVGSGNAAMCAAIAAASEGRRVVVVEKADDALAGGNSRYTAGAMRFAYDDGDQLLPLLAERSDPRLEGADFGSYPVSEFAADLEGFNDGHPLSPEQRALVEESFAVVAWLADRGVGFEPIYSRQSYEKDGRRVFWGGLTLAAVGEGEGLMVAEFEAFRALGGELRTATAAVSLLTDPPDHYPARGDAGRVVGVEVEHRSADGAADRYRLEADAVVLGSGGFESDPDLRVAHLGPEWIGAKVRGTPHNTGWGIEAAVGLGAEPYGFYPGCHATPMDLHMADYGNLDLPHGERKNYRKICYFLGVMVNAQGKRFVDEGRDFRNYTYAQFGRAVLAQPGHRAWQIFDAKVDDYLYEEYTFADAHYVEADDLDQLVERIEGIDRDRLRHTLADYNAAVDGETPFDPTIKDGRSTRGLALPKSNWALTIDTPPFRAYPVTGGITFTYGGLRVDDRGRVQRPDGSAIAGLFACGELVGGVFFHGYPGGSGLTSGAVFGRRAGLGAASESGG